MNKFARVGLALCLFMGLGFSARAEAAVNFQVGWTLHQVWAQVWNPWNFPIQCRAQLRGVRADGSVQWGDVLLPVQLPGTTRVAALTNLFPYLGFLNGQAAVHCAPVYVPGYVPVYFPGYLVP